MDKLAIMRIVKEEFALCKKNNYAALGAPDDPIWTRVEGGFAAGDDPLFAFYKQDIGDFLWLPDEAFRKFYPKDNISARDLSVLSLCFSIDDKTREIQKNQIYNPSLRWLYARNCYESIINDLCDRISSRLGKAGIRAITPDMHPDWAWQKSAKYGLASNWSQRHVAYIAGLGTFGLCDGLITRQGKAVRFASLILDYKLPADIRPYQNYHDWCLYYAKGACSSCIDSCPVQAIDESGHNKDICEKFIWDGRSSFLGTTVINTSGPFGCGLCQGKVPCQTGVPKGLDKGN